jgi:hypothetical protein
VAKSAWQISSAGSTFAAAGASSSCFMSDVS